MSPALEGPVSVCVDRQTLPLDRPFTYSLDASLEAGVGSLVKVPFHGRQVNGWVLGSTDDVPKRMLGVSKLVSPVAFFDERRLALLRWMSERYVTPLATAIDRSHPPRVAGEEDIWARAEPIEVPRPIASPDVLAGYVGGEDLVAQLAPGRSRARLRPAPG